jgi:hypothetical protein
MVSLTKNLGKQIILDYVKNTSLGCPFATRFDAVAPSAMHNVDLHAEGCSSPSYLF